MMLNQDPRGPVGQMARGTNTYMGASKSPYAGQMTETAMNSPTQPVGQMGLQGLQQASMLPQYKKPSLQEIARSVLGGVK